LVGFKIETNQILLFMNLAKAFYGSLTAGENRRIEAVFNAIYESHCTVESAVKNSDYLAIFKEGELRWLLPLCKNIDYRPMDDWRPYGFVSYFMWRIIVILYKTVPLVLLLFGAKAMSIHRAHPEVTDEPSSPVFDRNDFIVYVSTPSRTQKAVAFSKMRCGNRCILYAVKVPIEDEGAKSTANELRTYEALVKRNLVKSGAFLRKNVFYSPYISGQSTKCVFSKLHSSYLKKLVIGKTGTLRIILEHHLIENIYLNDELENNRRSLVAALSSSILDLAVPLAVVHGDFCPWNLKQAKNTLFPFDWEDSSLAGPVLWDVLHFVFSVDHRIHKSKSPKGDLLNTENIRDYIEHTKLTTSQVITVTNLYICIQRRVALLKGDVSFEKYLSSIDCGRLVTG
jgi:hypothetical protein